MENEVVETGIVKYSVRQAYNCEDNYWIDNGVSQQTGHRYLSLNSLGQSAKASTEIASSVKSNLGAVFPGGAIGKNGCQVTLNNEFGLGMFSFQVVVVAVDACSFTLKTLKWHPLIGTARHAIIKDASNECWLMQQGIGEPKKEGLVQFAINYHFAKKMWREMAANIKRLYL